MFIHSRKDWTRTRTTKKSRVVGTSCMGTQIVPEHIACVIAVRTYRRSLPDHWSTGTKTLGTSLAYIREYPTGMTCVPAIVECRYPAITFESCWYKNEHNETLKNMLSRFNEDSSYFVRTLLEVAQMSPAVIDLLRATLWPSVRGDESLAKSRTRLPCEEEMNDCNNED